MKIGTLEEVFSKMKEDRHTGFALFRLIEESQFGQRDAFVCLEGTDVMPRSLTGRDEDGIPSELIFGGGISSLNHLFRRHGRISVGMGSPCTVNFKKKDEGVERMGVWGRLLTPELASTIPYRADPSKVRFLSHDDVKVPSEIYDSLVKSGQVSECLSWEDGGDLLEQEETREWGEGKNVFLWRSAYYCEIEMNDFVQKTWGVPVLKYPEGIFFCQFKAVNWNRKIKKIAEWWDGKEHFSLTPDFITCLTT